jgi:hypothetical protein
MHAGFRVKPGRRASHVRRGFNSDHVISLGGQPGGVSTASRTHIEDGGGSWRKQIQQPTIIKTGERSYFLIGEWDSMQAMAAARPHMIATLDTFRDTLEDLGGGLGVTDPVSGEVVLKRTPSTQTNSTSQLAVMRSPPGPQMTLGNMRELGVQRSQSLDG